MRYGGKIKYKNNYICMFDTTVTVSDSVTSDKPKPSLKHVYELFLFPRII